MGVIRLLPVPGQYVPGGAPRDVGGGQLCPRGRPPGCRGAPPVSRGATPGNRGGPMGPQRDPNQAQGTPWPCKRRQQNIWPCWESQFSGLLQQIPYLEKVRAPPGRPRVPGTPPVFWPQGYPRGTLGVPPEVSQGFLGGTTNFFFFKKKKYKKKICWL